MVDAVIELSESNGTTPTVTDGIDNLNYGSVDECELVPKNNKITAGSNSYEKWIRFHVKSNPDGNTIQNIKVWMKRGSNPFDGAYIKTNARTSGYEGAQSYDTVNGPSASDRSATYKYSQSMPTSEPSTANIGIGGSLAGTMTSGYSDYWITQLQTGANTREWQDIDYEWEYEEV